MKIVNFDKDNASQELLGHAGISESYEVIIQRVSLEILRQSSPECEIEQISFINSAGTHPDFRVGGMPIEEGSDKIKLQDMTLPFDLKIIVCTNNVRHELESTFTFECKKMDEESENEFLLDIHEQKEV